MLTRRLFIERVAAIGGASLAYEAMTGLGLLEAQQAVPFGLRGEVDGVRVDGDRRRARRPDDRLRARQARLQGPGARGAAEAGRPGAHHPPRHGQRRGRTVADLRVRRRAVLQLRRDAHRVSPHDHARVLPRAAGAGRNVLGHLGRCLSLPAEGRRAVGPPRAAARGAHRPERLRLRAAEQGRVGQGARPGSVSEDDRERLLEYLRSAGGLDAQMRYRGGLDARARCRARRRRHVHLHAPQPERPPRVAHRLLRGLRLPVPADDAAGGGRHRSAAAGLCGQAQGSDRLPRRR